MKWIQRPIDTIASVGKPVAIACQADGSPQPKVLWKRLDSPQDLAIEFRELQFREVSLQDKGLYECRATNGADEDLIARVQLDVRGK